MNENRAYQKAIQLLVHPASITAILILLLNDHLLRQLWPSWLTGKLGDFAWLFFFPFALAALLAWLIPARITRQVQATGLLAFGLTGVIFSLTKTLPVFHATIVQAATHLFGFQVAWRRDPTDLIALSALIAGWLLWQRSPIRLRRTVNANPRSAWILLSLVTLLTVANAAQPEVGINCLEATTDQVIACSAYACYTSPDGGLTWAEAAVDRPSCPFYDYDPLYLSTTAVIESPFESGVQYRYARGEHIERSTDSGQTWQEELSLRPITQGERAYYFKAGWGNNAIVEDPPLAAVVDPATGNVIFAMGHAGVLVRQADGAYNRAAVGRFSPSRPPFATMLIGVLSGEMILALIFGGLGIATISLPQKRHWLRITALALGWLTWGVTSILFAPAIQEGPYSYLFPQAGTLVSGVLALVLAGEALIRTGLNNGKAALRLGLLLLCSALLYFVPFILWLVNFLPVYYLALGLGVVLGAGLLVWIHRKRLG